VGGPAGRALRDLRSEPRSGRQSRSERSPLVDRTVRGVEGRGRAHVRHARPPAALHGRRVRRDGALPVLHLVPRPRPGRSGPARPHPGIHEIRLAGPDRRSGRSGDLREIAAEPLAPRGAQAPGAASLLSALAGPAAGSSAPRRPPQKTPSRTAGPAPRAPPPSRGLLAGRALPPFPPPP